MSFFSGWYYFLFGWAFGCFGVAILHFDALHGLWSAGVFMFASFAIRLVFSAGREWERRHR